MELRKISLLLLMAAVGLISVAATPQVTSTSPIIGPVGTQVQVNGSGFGATQGSSTVKFNGAAGSVVSWSDSQVTAVVPTTATTGPVTITVAGQSSPSVVYFNVPPPVISSVSPASGSVTTQVTVAGSGFQAAKGSSSLTLNGVVATTTSWSDTQIVATVPANALTGAVRVNVNGVSSNSDVLFTLPNPVITSISPSTGPVNTQIQINGSGFGASQGSSSVTIGSGSTLAVLTVVTWSDTQINATLPATATTAGLNVTVGGVKNAQNLVFTVPPPQVTSVSPAIAVPGTQVTVSGTGFQATKGSNSITFNGANPSTISSWSDTQIVATIQSGTTTGPVRVFVNNITSNQDVLFTVPAPLVTSVSPVSGPVGTQITVVGSGFGATQGSSTLQIGGVAVSSISSWSDGQIVGTVPNPTSGGAVVVTVSGISNHAGDVVYTVPVPHVTSISPTSGPVGTQVTITGTGFRPTQTSGATNGSKGVAYVNNQQISVTSWSDTRVVGTVSASGTGAVSVATFSGSSNSDVIFTMPNPVISSLSPSSGPAGTQVQINGSGFGATQGSSTVLFTNVTPSIVSWSDTQIVVTLPSTAPTGAVKVTVGGITSNANLQFTVPPPHISTISPTSGVVGTQVTITGSGFQATKGTNSASIGGSLLTITSWSDTQIVATIPAGATSSFVRVTINGNDSNKENFFTLPNPVIAGFVPSGAAMGSQIQINGSGFGATQGTSTAAIGSTNISVISWSDTSITGAVPAGTTSGTVKVTIGGVSGTSSTFIVANLFVNSFLPMAGAAGTQVTVTGNGFGASQGTSTISFNNVGAAVSSWSDSQIVAAVPASATTGVIKVTVNGLSSSSSLSFTVGTVAVNSVSPNAGLAGTQVQINGSGFGITQGTVTFNGVSASINGWSDTLITATVPSSATTGAVRVTAGGVSSNTSVNFTVPTPVVAGVSPASGPSGTQVQISGAGFGSSQGTVRFGSSTGSVSSWSDTLIVATVPSSAIPGPVQVSVGSVSSNSSVWFTPPYAQVNSVSPVSGVVGTQVTLNGTGFQNSQGSISFNGTNATVVSWSDTQIVATVLAHSTTGPVKVTVNGLNISNQDVIFSMPNPMVASLSPGVGPTGTQVQINGNGFGATQGSSTISFNGVTATPISWSDTTITAAVPSTAASGSVSVSVGGITSNTSIKFTVPAPQVSSITPNRGTAGTQVTVTGANFQEVRGNSNLLFSGLNAIGTIVSWSDTQIVATVPNNAQFGPVSVSVNQVSSNQDTQFALINPRITSISPSSGAVATQVQINGTGFGTTQGTSTVAFSGSNASIVSWSDTQIIATVPANASSGAVTVKVSGINSSSNINFTVPAPKVTSISPLSGSVGTNLTINGSGFQSAKGGGSVSVNGAQSSIVSWSDTQIVIAVPAGAATGPVAVFTNNGQSSNQDIAFSMPNPIVRQLVPTSGPVLTQVQVNGNGFGATQGSSTITVNNSPATVVNWSDTQVVATVPQAAISGPVQITIGGVASNNTVYFNVPAPTISSLTPSSGGVGNTVTIAGTGFHSAQSSSSGTNFNTGGGTAIIKSWADTQIAAVVPSGTSTGSVNVLVNGIPSNYVNYAIPDHTISSLTPTSGPVGTQVTIAGNAFGSSQGTNTLTFNGQAATVSSWTNTQIVATVPVTAASGPVIVALNSINSNADKTFTVPPPSLSSVSPVGGIVGTQVTITGSGFQANQRDSTLTFNGTAATVTSWTDTQIVANVPTGATTGQVVVTVNSVASNSGKTFEVPNPTITSITPPEAPVNGTITINGSGFGASNWYSPDGVSTVYDGFVNFNGVQVGVMSWSNTSITTTVPSNAVTGSITISKFNATSNAAPFSVEGAPSVAGLAPSVGPVGGSVTITGSGFGATQSTSTVNFNGAQANVSTWGDTQIVAVVPSGTVTGPVSVSVAGVSGSTMNFIVNTSVQVTDSQAHLSSYTSAMIGGTWVGTDATGSGCTSCTIRGTIHDDFDSLGNLTAHTDELGRITNNVYDASFNLTSTTSHLDANTPVTTSYTYNSFGEPLTVTDPLGNVTTNTYDANGNLLTVTSPAPATGVAASVTQFAYDTEGELTQITDPLNHITTLGYYPTGLIHTITDAQLNVTSYEYDLRGNRTAVVDALLNRTTFAYDQGNRLTGITYPDNTIVSFGYDSRGRRTSVTDQNGHVTTYAYDDADRLTSVTDAANHMTQYAYDTENNLSSITDANLHTTSFSYDAFGRVTQTSFPSGLAETYVYDAASNLTSKTDRKAQTIQYVYDALNRLTHKGYPDATGVDYVYDLAGKIKQVTDPTGTYGFAYDNMGRLIGTTTQYSFLPGITYTNSYGYDAASNRTSFAAPDGSTNTYAYNAINRLSNLINSGAGQFTFSYDALGRRTQLTRPNGITSSYGYDPVSHLQSILHKLGLNTLDGASYTYDAAGNRLSKTNQLSGTVANFGYDAIYQLTGVTGSSAESYTYDPVGNRLTSAGVPSYSYNSSNELTLSSAATYTYDANGNTLSRSDSGGTTAYGWDFENRLTSVQLPNQTTVTFKYDPFGRRIQKGGSAYVYDEANLMDETDVSGNLLAKYVFGSGIDEPLASYRGGTWELYQADALGSITSLSTSSGTISHSFTYDSFGNVTSSTGIFTQPFRYTGRESDSETGLYFYRARYYDSQVGRFLTEDPLRFRAGFNFYPYVGNDPIIYRDPFGLLRNCDQEHIECFRKCWSQCPPWPIDRGKRGHYLYCQSKCLAEYMECEAQNAAEKTKNTVDNINNTHIPVLDPLADYLREWLKNRWRELQHYPGSQPYPSPGPLPLPPPIPAFP